jgi:hypothetical protein
MKQRFLGVLVCVLLVTATIPAVLASPRNTIREGILPDDAAKTRVTSELNITFWGGIGVNADIKNDGPAMNVSWQLEVRGSILGLIHKTSSGVLVVQGGESRWVSTGPFLGIGPFTVTGKANEFEKTAKGFVLLFYVIIFGS